MSNDWHARSPTRSPARPGGCQTRTMDEPDIRLRSATAADADVLLAWRNDAGTRAASFNSEEIPRDGHVRWLAAKLNDPDCALLIVEAQGEAVGQVRLDRSDEDRDVAEIHIALDPAARGRSIGRRALRAAVGEAPAKIGAHRIEARVKPENEASLRAFEAAGFRVVSNDADVVKLIAEP
jgi:RimJ/RimL family protein N-acetyltransferase